MKKAILWIVFILLTAVSSLSANTLKADASAISLSVTNMILDKGYEDFLSIKKDGKFLDYEDYSDKTKWSTSDPSVATVSDDGTVMGKGYGTATITAAYEGKKYTCKVTVKQLKTLKSDSTTTVKLKGKVRKQTFPISGNGDMGNAYVLTVDTPFILSYDQGGLRDEMSLINEVQIYPEHGDTVIGKYVTVTGRLLSAQSSTYYCSYGLMDTNVISITSAGDLNEASKILDINGTVTLTVTGVNKGISWKSSDKSIAAVDAKGKVTGKKAGTATITASFNGKKKTCKITVINAAQYLKGKWAISEGKISGLKWVFSANKLNINDIRENTYKITSVSISKNKDITIYFTLASKEKWKSVLKYSSKTEDGKEASKYTQMEIFWYWADIEQYSQADTPRFLYKK